MFLSKPSQRKNRLFEETLPEFIEYIKVIKGLKKNEARILQGSHFEKMEKILILLEQEGIELEQLLRENLHSKDEIDTFLRNKPNTKLINPSGAQKILEAVAFRHAENPLNYDNLLKVVEKNIESEIPKSSNKKNLIHEITRNIFSKVQKAQQKKIKDQSVFTLEHYHNKTMKFDLDSLALDKEVQTEDEEEYFRKKSIAVRKMMKNKEIDAYTKDLEEYNEEILRKCHAYELQKNKLENEKSDIVIKLKEKEMKLKIKKGKKESLKLLVKELKDKLQEFAEKEAKQLLAMKNKENDYEKLMHKQEESNQILSVHLKEINTKNDFLEKRIKEDKILRINNKIEEKSSGSVSPSNKVKEATLNTSQKDLNQKKSSIKKRKRASTVDSDLISRLTQPKKPVISPQIVKLVEITKKKGADYMNRRSTAFVSNSNKAESSLKIEETIEKTKFPPSITVSKSLIGSNSSENKLEILEEDSKSLKKNEEDSMINTPIIEIIEASLEKESGILEKEDIFKKKNSFSMNEIEEIEILKEKIKPKKQEIGVMANKKEILVNFMDKTEIYINKLQNMVEKNHEKMHFILEKIFAHRNHKVFIDDLTVFLKNSSIKKSEKNTQTEDLMSISQPNLKKNTMNDSRIMSKTRNKGFIGCNNCNNQINLNKNSSYQENNEDTKRNYDMNSYFQENLEETLRVFQREKAQKSQSQHVSGSNVQRVLGSNIRILEMKSSIKEDYLKESEEKKIESVVKFASPASFLFNKAIKSDVFDELNRFNVNSQGKIMREKDVFLRKNSTVDEILIKIDLAKEKEENFERELLIHRLNQHIQEIKENNVDNYSKIKHFFKYPFKSVNDRLGNPVEIGVDDGKIEDLIKKFVNKHRVCGKNCIYQ